MLGASRRRGIKGYCHARRPSPRSRALLHRDQPSPKPNPVDAFGDVGESALRVFLPLFHSYRDDSHAWHRAAAVHDCVPRYLALARNKEHTQLFVALRSIRRFSHSPSIANSF